MKCFPLLGIILFALVALAIFLPKEPEAAEPAESRVADPEFVDIFNGVDLTGWVDVNTSQETWSVRDGMLIYTGRPIGVMLEKQYENFILIVEWRHMEEGGNSGVFLWSDAVADRNETLPNGMEVQMLELGWPDS